MLNPEQIARVCHEANRALQIELNDPAVPVSPPWDEAPESQRSSCIDGVHGHQAEPLTPAESHAMWLAYKEADGWVWGEVKDEAAKTHPCMVPYEELSVVSAPYEIDGRVVGTLGVIGPTRMAYDRMIQIVDITSRLVGNALSQR